ncbi:unconventional prefoldin RPB5 interactor 1 isoform X2 [Esox lucius]|uniref:Protein phosphatase 1 regulatory subunit 19 n=1 Tax=Esox lucius TaxID=8010 RepID=A0A6Q2YWX4_ESOLU|nr:unconventional prefoldin RPB5 interactor 1 isoform X2 [Esox lucius]
MAERNKRNVEAPQGVGRLRVEHEKVVKGCEDQIQHWKNVKGDYEVLEDRLKTLPDKVSYDIMVPFGPLAFMPGKLVHTNEITVLLGDNWFAKCSAKQAQMLVEHRKKHVQSALDDLHKTKKNFEARVGFTEDLEKLSDGKGGYVDIREELEGVVCKGKRRVSLKPHSKPKTEAIVKMEEEEEEEMLNAEGSKRGVLSEEELWARLDELEAQEQQEEELDRRFDSADTNGNDDTTSSSSEEEKDEEGDRPAERSKGGTTMPLNGSQVDRTALPPRDGGKEEQEDDEEDDGLPTIHFSHTVEPKKVRINTGKNTTLKFSEMKEQKQQAKRKKNNGTSNGHSHHGLHITSPTDIYRLFVDVKNGEPVPRKSILKSRSRENSVCSDTSESSAADFEERRTLGRSPSHDDNTYSDTGSAITEEDAPTGELPVPTSRFQAFSGTVVEKEPIPLSVPQLTIAPPALPTIPERKLEEVVPEAPQEAPQEAPKRVSKFKAARLQHKGP